MSVNSQLYTNITTVDKELKHSSKTYIMTKCSNRQSGIADPLIVLCADQGSGLPIV